MESKNLKNDVSNGIGNLSIDNRRQNSDYILSSTEHIIYMVISNGILNKPSKSEEILQQLCDRLKKAADSGISQGWLLATELESPLEDMMQLFDSDLGGLYFQLLRAERFVKNSDDTMCDLAFSRKYCKEWAGLWEEIDELKMTEQKNKRLKDRATAVSKECFEPVRRAGLEFERQCDAEVSDAAAKAAKSIEAAKQAEDPLARPDKGEPMPGPMWEAHTKILEWLRLSHPLHVPIDIPSLSKRTEIYNQTHDALHRSLASDVGLKLLRCILMERVLEDRGHKDDEMLCVLVPNLPSEQVSSTDEAYAKDVAELCDVLKCLVNMQQWPVEEVAENVWWPNFIYSSYYERLLGCAHYMKLLAESERCSPERVKPCIAKATHWFKDLAQHMLRDKQSLLKELDKFETSEGIEWSKPLSQTDLRFVLDVELNSLFLAFLHSDAEIAEEPDAEIGEEQDTALPSPNAESAEEEKITERPGDAISQKIKAFCDEVEARVNAPEGTKPKITPLGHLFGPDDKTDEQPTVVEQSGKEAPQGDTGRK